MFSLFVVISGGPNSSSPWYLIQIQNSRIKWFIINIGCLPGRGSHPDDGESDPCHEINAFVDWRASGLLLPWHRLADLKNHRNMTWFVESIWSESEVMLFELCKDWAETNRGGGGLWYAQAWLCCPHLMNDEGLGRGRSCMHPYFWNSKDEAIEVKWLVQGRKQGRGRSGWHSCCMHL
jgi:hypothetical protein